MNPAMTIEPRSFRTWRSLGTLLALAAVAVTLACGEEEGVLVGEELQGEWRYEMLDFTGSGASCHAAPATGWAIKYRQTSEYAAYQVSFDSLYLDCTIPGASPQHWLLREESTGPDGVAWLYFDAALNVSGEHFSGCLLPTPARTWVDGVIVVRALSITCTPSPIADGEALVATRTINLRVPDTTGAPTYTLTGTTRLFRP